MTFQEKLNMVLTELAEQAISHPDSPRMVATKVLSHQSAILDLIEQDVIGEDYTEKSTKWDCACGAHHEATPIGHSFINSFKAVQRQVLRGHQ